MSSNVGNSIRCMCSRSSGMSSTRSVIISGCHAYPELSAISDLTPNLGERCAVNISYLCGPPCDQPHCHPRTPPAFLSAPAPSLVTSLTESIGGLSHSALIRYHYADVPGCLGVPAPSIHTSGGACLTLKQLPKEYMSYSHVLMTRQYRRKHYATQTP